VQNARIDEREITANSVQHPQDTHAHVQFDVPRGDAVVHIAYSGGVALVPVTPGPVVGEATRAMKIVGVELKDRVYTIELDHLGSEPTAFELRTPWKIEDVSGATSEAVAPSSWRLEIAASPGNDKRAYRRSKVMVMFTSVD
jgi:hypothetical protein